jgi:hypothetical protein
MEAARFWLVVGTPENWHTAFDYGGIWGLRPTQKRYWDRLQENRDLILMYVTSPISGVVGSGIVRTKLHQISPLWPEERGKNAVIWPFRFEFDVLSNCLPPSQWADGRVALDELKSRVRSGFQELEPALATEILRGLPSKDNSVDLVLSPSLRDETILPTPRSPMARTDDQHRHIQSLLSEIGRLQKFVTDTEFPLENRRVDVVWRRVQRSVPSYVFEVQVGGNLTEAMAKLKQAFEFWNSNIFLVGKSEHKNPALQMCDGSFHEIKGRLKFLQSEHIEELYRLKRAYRDFEHNLGILSV